MDGVPNPGSPRRGSEGLSVTTVPQIDRDMPSLSCYGVRPFRRGSISTAERD
jgi:hypothetical protein